MHARILLSILIGCTVSALGCAHSQAEQAAPAAPAAVAPSPAIETKEVSYAAGETKLQGFVAYPAAPGKHPGVIVVHEWWGHNDYARSRAKQLAEMGYVGFAIDMYGDGKAATHPDDAKKFMMEALSDMDRARQRFEAAKALLANDARVDGEKLAAIGYCFGGAVVLTMARSGSDLDAVASFHGNLSTQQPMAQGAYRGRIFVAAGAADPFVPKEQVEAFKQEMDAAGASYEVVEYEGAKHSFTNPAATEAGAKYQLPLEYDAEADHASWQKLSALLGQIWN